MERKSWVIKEGAVFRVHTGIGKPPGALYLSPIHEGKQVRDGDWLDFTDSEATVNAGKKAAKMVALQAEADADQARLDSGAARADKIRGKKVADLTGLPEIKQTIEDILDYLGLG